MKRNLGSIIALVTLFFSPLWGNYEWKLLDHPTTLNVGQSGLVRYACAFDGSASEYSIQLLLESTPHYTTSLLNQHTTMVKGKRIEIVELLITPKIAGKLTLSPNARVRFTALGAVENTVLGRDNLSKEDIINTQTHLPPLTIDTRANGVALNGHFTLDVHTDTQTLHPYQPLHLRITLKGAGNFDALPLFDLNLSEVKQFLQPPQKSLTPSQEGFVGEVTQSFALVSSHPYTIPALHLSYFDTTTQKIITLSTQPIPITIDDAGYTPDALLDAPLPLPKSNLLRYLIYGGLIALGVVLGEAVRWVWHHRPKRRQRFFWDNASDAKSLIILLSLRPQKRYDAIITALESGTMGVRDAKRALKEIEKSRTQGYL
jgi:hypothetical protein